MNTSTKHIHLNTSLASSEQCYIIGKATFEFIKRLQANPETNKMLEERTALVRKRRLEEERRMRNATGTEYANCQVFG